MKRFLIFLVFVLYICNIAVCQNSLPNHHNNPYYDSSASKSPFNFLQAGGQVLAGTAAGAIFALPFYQANPTYGYIAWFAGSSLGVYLIGNIGNHESSYWATLTGGFLGTYLFLVSFQEKEGGYPLMIEAALAAIPFELLCYYFFRSDTDDSPGVSDFLKNTPRSYSIMDRPITNPDFSIQLINISF